MKTKLNPDQSPKEKLLPCPFCGREPELRELDENYDWRIVCSLCHVNTPKKGLTKEQAIQWWSTRAPLTALIEENNRLILALEIHSKATTSITIKKQEIEKELETVKKENEQLKQQAKHAASSGNCASKSLKLCTFCLSLFWQRV